MYKKIDKDDINFLKSICNEEDVLVGDEISPFILKLISPTGSDN